MALISGGLPKILAIYFPENGRWVPLKDSPVVVV